MKQRDPWLVLASASPRRRELLGLLGVPFAVRPVEVDETPPDLPPEEAVQAIALRKLVSAANQRAADAIALVADTIVVCDGALLGKPPDTAAARQMLRALRGRRHQVFTAVAAAGAVPWSTVVRSDVLMRLYTDEEIESSIRAGTPFDKAGGYAIQDPLLHPVARCDGCYCAVMGLPLWPVYELLRSRCCAGCAAETERQAVRSPASVVPRCTTCPLRAAGS